MKQTQWQFLATLYCNKLNPPVCPWSLIHPLSTGTVSRVHKEPPGKRHLAWISSQ